MTAFLPDMVTIGKVERPFGVHGAVKVRSLSDRPGRFEQLHEVRMAGERGQTIDRRVRSVRKAGPVYIVEFEGITTPEEARGIQGAMLQVPRGEASASPDEPLYECDLIGMTVVDETGRDLGRLDTIWELPGHQVLVVKQADREVLIPAVKEFVTGVDVAQGRMTVRTLEGMVEV
ncbi:MAG TPA: ribosome maturation factor RimM [Nitrospira sp.]|jgi:16S rRNA processing protein RimM|nr:ribosome maturation factor RimM [Nitrospira sp.]